MTSTITVSTHPDFLGCFDDDETVKEYEENARKCLSEIGYDDIVFDGNQRAYLAKAPFSRGSDEYRDIEDALELAWQMIIS